MSLFHASPAARNLTILISFIVRLIQFHFLTLNPPHLCKVKLFNVLHPIENGGATQFRKRPNTGIPALLQLLNAV